MKERDLERLRLKAEAFDQVVEKYKSLKDDAGFYSKNWVELTEVIEAALRRVQKAP